MSRTTMNRLSNAKNEYQTEAKRVLTVCSSGLLRSPTAANVLHAEYGYNTRACGVALEYALVQMDEVLIEWADEIVFVESWMYESAKALYPRVSGKRAVLLDVPDDFEWNAPALRDTILTQYREASAYV